MPSRPARVRLWSGRGGPLRKSSRNGNGWSRSPNCGVVADCGWGRRSGLARNLLRQRKTMCPTTIRGGRVHPQRPAPVTVGTMRGWRKAMGDPETVRPEDEATAPASEPVAAEAPPAAEQAAAEPATEQAAAEPGAEPEVAEPQAEDKAEGPSQE